MRILFDSNTVFSKKYESFDDLSNEFVDYESAQGRTVPSFNYDAWILELVIFILTFIHLEIQSRRDSEGVERRHEELLMKLDELKSSQKVSSEDIVSSILEDADKKDIKIEVYIETEVEWELWDTFQKKTRSESVHIRRDHFETSSIPSEHDRSLAEDLEKYGKRGSKNHEDEETAWEEHVAEEWDS